LAPDHRKNMFRRNCEQILWYRIYCILFSRILLQIQSAIHPKRDRIRQQCPWATKLLVNLISPHAGKEGLIK
jgi:hypothetical protein